MSKQFKDYLGAVEFSLDKLIYEIGVREYKSGVFKGTWTCPLCGVCGISANAITTPKAAIELGKFLAAKHHDQYHAFPPVEKGLASKLVDQAPSSTADAFESRRPITER